MGTVTVGVGTAITLNSAPTKNSNGIIEQCPTSSLTSQAQQEIQNLLSEGQSGEGQNSEEGASSGDSPPLPDRLMGTQDGRSRLAGDRQLSGPLDPANGGTGNARDDFEILTGGNHRPATTDDRLPPGSLVGQNGVIYRPPRGSDGSWIDIPSNPATGKPHETLHYPPN